jgi:outer membrane biosynthesis protein TonB
LAGWRTLTRRHWVPLLLAAGALFACSQQPAPAPPPKPAAAETPPPAPPPVAHYARRVVPRPDRKPTPPEEVASTETPPAEAVPAEAPPEAVTPPAEAPAEGRLIGLDQRTAIRLFGAAAERSERAPATVWRYTSNGCELDLYFYLDLKSGQMRTLHYAFKGTAQDAAQRQECLRAIVDRSRQPGSPHAASAAR